MFTGEEFPPGPVRTYHFVSQFPDMETSQSDFDSKYDVMSSPDVFFYLLASHNSRLPSGENPENPSYFLNRNAQALKIPEHDVAGPLPANEPCRSAGGYSAHARGPVATGVRGRFLNFVKMFPDNKYSCVSCVLLFVKCMYFSLDQNTELTAFVAGIVYRISTSVRTAKNLQFVCESYFSNPRSRLDILIHHSSPCCRDL